MLLVTNHTKKEHATPRIHIGFANLFVRCSSDVHARHLEFANTSIHTLVRCMTVPWNRNIIRTDPSCLVVQLITYKIEGGVSVPFSSQMFGKQL